MKAKDVVCKSCTVGKGKCMPEDEGPFLVVCTECGEETNVWAYAREAWAEWKRVNHLPAEEVT